MYPAHPHRLPPALLRGLTAPLLSRAGCSAARRRSALEPLRRGPRSARGAAAQPPEERQAARSWSAVTSTPPSAHSAHATADNCSRLPLHAGARLPAAARAEALAAASPTCAPGLGLLVHTPTSRGTHQFSGSHSHDIRTWSPTRQGSSQRGCAVDMTLYACARQRGDPSLTTDDRARARRYRCGTRRSAAPRLLRALWSARFTVYDVECVLRHATGALPDPQRVFEEIPAATAAGTRCYDARPSG